MSRLSRRFEILHRARKPWCRALCKISKQLDARIVRYRRANIGGFEPYAYIVTGLLTAGVRDMHLYHVSA